MICVRTLTGVIAFGVASSSSLSAQHIVSQAAVPMFARAAERSTPPAQPAQPARLPLIAERERSPLMAFGLSLAGTLVPIAVGTALALQEEECGTPPPGQQCPSNSGTQWAGGALAAAGLMAGPSTGYYYGRRGSRGTNGILLRSAVVATTLLISIPVERDAGIGPESPLPLIGALVVVGSAVWDIATVHRSVASGTPSTDSSAR